MQGTLYSDVIESGGRDRRGDDQVPPQRRWAAGRPAFELVEPLRALFKDEVRAVGAELGLPERLVWRQPFPGPGLAIRIVGGEATKERLDVLREADDILQDEIRKAGLYRELWQSFCVLPDVRTVGVQGDERTYGYVVVIRAVTSDDAMTADWARLPYDLLETIASRMINELREVNRVVLDITSKPPGTIEWGDKAVPVGAIDPCARRGDRRRGGFPRTRAGGSRTALVARSPSLPKLRRATSPMMLRCAARGAWPFFHVSLDEDLCRQAVRPPARLVCRRRPGQDARAAGDADRGRAAGQAQADLHAAHRHRRLRRSSSTPRRSRVTGNKRADKLYHRHSGYPGGLRTRTFEQMITRRPEEVIRLAVKGMMPRNRLARKQLTKLKVYAGPGASARRAEAATDGDRA